MIKRIIADAVLFLSIFFAPWYATVILGVLFMILFGTYWEVVIAGFFLDSIHSILGDGLFGYFGVFSFSSLFLLLIIERFKINIRI